MKPLCLDIKKLLNMSNYILIHWLKKSGCGAFPTKVEPCLPYGLTFVRLRCNRINSDVCHTVLDSTSPPCVSMFVLASQCRQAVPTSRYVWLFATNKENTMTNNSNRTIRPDLRLDRTVLRSAVRSTEDPRHVVGALQRREVAGAWQGDPLNIR